MSVESGIAPFRGPGGLWERFDPEEYAHVETLRRSPDKAWILFRLIEEAVRLAEPHEGHRALARLEEAGLLSAVVTQNVDGLHRRAGSRRVVEFHGCHETMSCFLCGRPATIDRLPDEPEIPRCDCGGVLRPDVVLFGEAIPEVALEAAHRETMSCEVMLVVGCSVAVYPAAALPVLAHTAGATVIEVNPEPTPLTANPGTLFVQGTALGVLPALAAAALEG
jgi:NAD-dependent deacetylase